MKMNSQKYFVILIFFTVVFSSCKKFIEVDPPKNFLIAESVFDKDNTAIAFMNGIYTSYSLDPIPSMSLYVGLYSDEIRLTDANNFEGFLMFYKNNLKAVSFGADFWSTIYPLVYRCNLAIEKLPESNGLNPVVRNQLLGEAMFMRALLYSHLVSLYGDVPLAITSNYQINRELKRTDVAIVYAQIAKDLNEAKDLLTDTYASATLTTSASGNSRIRPNKWAAKALLSRIYLYAEKYSDAETVSSEVIANTGLYELPKLNTVFVKGSREAIFQIQPTNLEFNTIEGYNFTASPTGPSNGSLPGDTYLSASLISSFEAGDQRFSDWLKSIKIGNQTYYYPYKYKLGAPSTPGGEYSVILRMAEQYLIRAEARIRQGGTKVQEGVKDLNIIRERARAVVTLDVPNPLPALSLSMSQNQAITAVEHERQIELFSEWGHRWIDIKRTKRVDAIMLQAGASKGVQWESYMQYFPIPNSEILLSPGLSGHQNTGY